jgi:hypothetical protein
LASSDSLTLSDREYPSFIRLAMLDIRAEVEEKLPELQRSGTLCAGFEA